MALRLNADQRDFLDDNNLVRNLAEWIIREPKNHMVVRVRQLTSLRQSDTPGRRAVTDMIEYLTGQVISTSDLIHLINGYNHTHREGQEG
jgi:hypothetical protein